MSQDKILQAINLFKAGNKKQAGEILQEVVAADPSNAEAWYGLALCAETTEKSRNYLNKLLAINPQHAKAQALLEKMDSMKPVNSPVDNKKARKFTPMMASSILIGLLILSVGWLFYKVSVLEKSLLQTQYDLSTTESKLLDTQFELQNTQSDLSSTISSLSYVRGLAVNANNYAHSHNSFSDARLKKDINEIEDPLNGILALHGVEFSWDTTGYPEMDLNNYPQIGFIAQEVELIYPQLVKTDDSGFKTVDYPKLIPVLVEAIKQQQTIINDLQQQIAEIRQAP